MTIKKRGTWEPGTLSLILEKEKKLPSRYHEHVCFVDHDMGKILVFCKSSIFHDLLKKTHKTEIFHCILWFSKSFLGKSLTFLVQ